MVSRSLLAIFGIALFAAVAIAASVEDEVIDVDNLEMHLGEVERGPPTWSTIEAKMKSVFSRIGREWKNLNKTCITKQALKCWSSVLDPASFLTCAVKKLKKNGWCYSRG